MSDTIVLTFPFVPPSELRKNNQGANRFAISAAKNKVKAEAMLQLAALGYGPSRAYLGVWRAAQVQYVSFFSGTPIDATEFATGMGAAVDCLSPEKIVLSANPYVRPGIGLLPDDNPSFVVCLPTKYRRVKKADIKTVMIVTEIEATEWEYEGEIE